MPSPVGHALGGLIVALALTPKLTNPIVNHVAPTWQRLLRVPAESGFALSLCMAAACLPDIDFAWGRHNMETHSVGFAMLLGLAVWMWQRDLRLAIACALATSTHVLFDWLGSDDAPPFGVMALWPFTQQFFYADAWVFGAISRHYWRSDFVSQNVLAVLRELAILVPIVAALAVARTRRR